MPELYYVDLMAVLRAFKEGMKGCTLYGRIVRQVKYPSVIKQGVALAENGQFVVMEAFAVNVGKYDTYLRERGVQNKDGIYMVNGNVLAYVDKTAVNGVDWYQITGTLRRPSQNTTSNCVAMLNFYKDASGAWALSPCRVEDLDISSWDRHCEPYAWINASGDANCIKHPPEVLCLPRFEDYDSTTTPTLAQPPAPPPAPEQPILLANSQQAPASIGRFIKENRQSVKECGAMYGEWTGVAKTAEKLKKSFVDTLKASYTKDSCPDSYLSYMLNGILVHFSKRRTQYALTGKALIKKYLDTNSLAREDYLGHRSAGDFLADSFHDIKNYILDNDVYVNAEGVALDLCKAMFSDKEAFYAGIVGVVLNISSDTITDMVAFCANQGLSITKILNENPYMLQFFTTLGYDEIERIAMCFGKHEDASLSKYRNVAMLNAYISDTDNGSTVFEKASLMRANIGVRLTKTKFDKVRNGVSYLTEAMCMNIDSYIRDTRTVTLTYSARGFKSVNGGYYVKALDKAEVEVAIQNYIETGLGVVLGDYITSSDLLKKELFVFDTMLHLASKTHDYKREDIAKCITEYEELVGFKLEKSQVDAVYLLVNSAFVVAGSAGSGKTTVSKCVVYTLRKLSPNLEIKFAAPTGKAAKRMQEVVQEECRTLHSTFKIGQSADTLFDSDEATIGDSDTAFFFDEGAMITVDLLYKVLKKVDTGSARIFLFGDFNQLPPIGKGLPFKNLLRFMPCVFLDVVKRAAEGSNITANSFIVNEHSDGSKWQWLKNGKDFFLLNCGGERIQDIVYKLCAHYLGKEPDNGRLAQMLGVDSLPVVDGLTPDDIQVVSPLTKETYQWGATVLNRVLQPLFNPSRAYNKTFIYQTTKFTKPVKFMIGDRVIHTDKNMYSMQWYGTYQGGHFEKIYGQGICNGEVGKVVAFLPIENAHFYDEKEPKPDDFEYTEALRQDDTYGAQNGFFVVVEYFDFISARNFYILYRAELNGTIESNEGIVLKGEDVQKLNLFYAGTTHKLQGSQAKLIIFVLDDINFSGFVTRQMVYTMMTRAEKLCFGVGSVGNSRNSMLTRARLDIASVDTLTVGELLV